MLEEEGDSCLREGYRGALAGSVVVEFATAEITFSRTPILGVEERLESARAVDESADWRTVFTDKSRGEVPTIADLAEAFLGGGLDVKSTDDPLLPRDGDALYI